MELIYLWVEEYKNIHKQGFNFSGRYRCEYDEAKNELMINENKDYVHIFQDNINVTAIVGENGSGKTSILEEIMTTSPSGLIVYKQNQQFQVFGKKGLKVIANLPYGFLEKNYHGNTIHTNSDIMKLDRMGDVGDYFQIRTQLSSEALN